MKSELAKICQQCHRPTMFTRSKCSVCHLMVCVGCVAWDFMDKTKTEQIVCKDCAKLFTNYKGDN